MFSGKTPIFLFFSISTLIIGYAQEPNRIDDLPKLNIGPRKPIYDPTARYKIDDSKKLSKDGMQHVIFWVNPAFFDDVPVDPFDPIKPHSSHAKTVLANKGITFPNGSLVVYNPANNLLFLKNTPNQLKLIKRLVGESPVPTSFVHVRAEIYELPAINALEIVEKGCKKPHQTQERNAIVNMVKKGNARLITVVSQKNMSGNRTQFENTQRSLVFTGINSTQPKLLPTYKSLRYGTILKVDTIIGYNNQIDLRYSLEHHVAPPRLVDKTIITPTGSPSTVSSVEASKTTISSEQVIESDTYSLIGHWRSKDQPQIVKNGMIQLGFLYARITTLTDNATDKL